MKTLGNASPSDIGRTSKAAYHELLLWYRIAPNNAISCCKQHWWKSLKWPVTLVPEIFVLLSSAQTLRLLVAASRLKHCAQLVVAASELNLVWGERKSLEYVKPLLPPQISSKTNLNDHLLRFPGTVFLLSTKHKILSTISSLTSKEKSLHIPCLESLHLLFPLE